MSVKCEFLCVGAQKGGTTTLRHYLSAHPRLIVPVDEIHFFDNEALDWENPDYNCYHSLLRRGLLGSGCIGEVTPIYMYWSPCNYRIHRYNPGMKLIFILRNPMVRAFSQWSMEFNRGSERLGFSDCIRSERDRIQAAGGGQHRVYSYLARGLYFEQVCRFIELFSIDQMLFLSSESFYGDLQCSLNKVTRFLGVDDFEVVSPVHLRRGDYGAAMTFEDWEYMFTFFRADIERLEDFLGWDLSGWRQPLCASAR